MKTNERLKAARQDAGYRFANDAAQAFGWPKSTYLAHESGGRGIPIDKLRLYATAYGVTLSQLLGEGQGNPAEQRSNMIYSGRPEIPKRFLPVYGSASCGSDGEFELNGERMADVICPPNLELVKDAYAVQVSGTSMFPQFDEGYIVWVDPTRTPRKGNPVVAEIQQDEYGPPLAFIKRLVRRSMRELVLLQIYPEERELVFDNAKVRNVHLIVGALYESAPELVFKTSP